MPLLLLPAGKTLFLSHFPPPLLPPPRLQLRRATATATDAGDDAAAAASGTRARERRLAKVREERRRSEYDRQHTYPGWARVLENACRDGEEMRTILGDSMGNPELMKQRMQERVRKKGREGFNRSKTGSVAAFKVSFREVDLGTSDYLGLDVLLNCLTQLSLEDLGIKQVVFGGRKLGDWEEGMTSSDYGYKHFKI